MGALFSAEWGKTKAEDVWQGGEEEARNGSRNGLKFIARTQPDSPARPRGCDGVEEVSELRRGDGTEGGREGEGEAGALLVLCYCHRSPPFNRFSTNSAIPPIPKIRK